MSKLLNFTLSRGDQERLRTLRRQYTQLLLGKPLA
jgi:hypothetical protein